MNPADLATIAALHAAALAACGLARYIIPTLAAAVTLYGAAVLALAV